jgi:Kef-type K+ transport system membrane component KefB
MVLSAIAPLPALDEHSLLVFWCQFLIVLLAARACGYVTRRLGQPRVIGELLAGVLLGPSVLGGVWRDGFDWLFPASARQAGLLLGVAWVGIVFLLAVTGAEIDVATIATQGRVAVTTTIGSLFLPLAAGALLASQLPDGFIGIDGTRPIFMAFFAVAFAISSLPVAARILGDMGLLDQPFAQLSLGVATANDVVGWLLLGVVVSISEAGSFAIVPLAVAVVVLATISVGAVKFGGRFLDAVMVEVRRRDGGPAAEVSVIVLVVVAFGTLTQAVGVEVVIGAFIAGIAIGQSRIRDGRGFDTIVIVTNGVFAPLFFAVAGLRVDLARLTSTTVIGWTVAVTLVASAAKIVGSYVGGRAGGLDHTNAFRVGAALNARGALEIVVATVGLSLGVIDRTAYTVIVVMAIVTTAVAGPLLTLAQPKPRA